MSRLSSLLHRLAHRLDSSPLWCACELRGRSAGWRAHHAASEKEAALRRRGEPTRADAMDEWLRRVIADSERDAA